MPSTPVSGRAAMPKPAPSAATTPIRTATPTASPSWPAGTTPGWSRSRSAARVGRAPLRVRRIVPGENVNLVAAEQIRSWLRQRQPLRRRATPLPIFSFDAGYDAVQLSLALADEPVCLLVRLRAGRCFYADPTTQPPTGRPRRHGAKFVCDDPTTWPSRPTSGRPTIPQYGHVRLQAWSGLHPHPAAATRTAAPAPSPRPPAGARHADPPGGRAPAAADQDARSPSGSGGAGPSRPIWRTSGGPTSPASRSSTPSASSSRRFKWTTPKLRSAARRLTAGPGCCSWPMSSLRLARDVVADVRLPWQRPLPPERRTPARVRRGLFVAPRDTWAVPSTCQNPADARRGGPKASARHPPSGFQRSN